MIAAREEWCSFCNKMHPIMIGGCNGFRAYFKKFELINDSLDIDLVDRNNCIGCPNNKPGATCHCTLGGNIIY